MLQMREMNLIHEGSLASQAILEGGGSRTSIPLFEYSTGEVKGMYPPGDHTLVATDSDDQEHEHELTIEPASEIVNVDILETTFGAWRYGSRTTAPARMPCSTPWSRAKSYQSRSTSRTAPRSER